MTTRNDLVTTLFHAGHTDEEIAKAVSLSVSRTSVIRQKLGLRREPNNKTPDETIKLIRKLSDEGWPPGEISETLGVSAGVAHRWSNDTSGPEWRAMMAWINLNHLKLYRKIQMM